jgi:predicted HicB family RNase H-like nuclease
MKYKGYIAVVDFDETTKVFSGHVAGLEGAIMFQSEHADELEAEFKDSVDFYLEMCAKHGTEPEKTESPGLKYRAHQIVEKVFA